MDHNTPYAARPFRCAILTISDRAAQGIYEDRTGPEVAAAAAALGWDVVASAILPDDEDGIAGRLRDLADRAEADIVLTAGGTGLGPRDRTPEATARIAERHVPGIAERIRARTGETFPAAYLSRGLAVTRARTLIVNLPGSVRGARDCLAAVADILPHALDVLREDPARGAAHPGQEPREPGSSPQR